MDLVDMLRTLTRVQVYMQVMMNKRRRILLLYHAMNMIDSDPEEEKGKILNDEKLREDIGQGGEVQRLAK